MYELESADVLCFIIVTISDLCPFIYLLLIFLHALKAAMGGTRLSIKSN